MAIEVFTMKFEYFSILLLLLSTCVVQTVCGCSNLWTLCLFQN